MDIKSYYPSLISEKQIDFSIISEDNTSNTSDCKQYIQMDVSRLHLQKETTVHSNVCPTCKFNCSVYKCSRLYTYCELYSIYNNDDLTLYDYHFDRHLSISSKTRTQHYRTINKHRRELVQFDFDRQVKQSNMQISYIVFLFLQRLNDYYPSLITEEQQHMLSSNEEYKKLNSLEDFKNLAEIKNIRLPIEELDDEI